MQNFLITAIFHVRNVRTPPWSCFRKAEASGSCKQSRKKIQAPFFLQVGLRNIYQHPKGSTVFFFMVVGLEWAIFILYPEPLKFLSSKRWGVGTPVGYIYGKKPGYNVNTLIGWFLVGYRLTVCVKYQESRKDRDSLRTKGSPGVWFCQRKTAPKVERLVDLKMMEIPSSVASPLTWTDFLSEPS